MCEHVSVPVCLCVFVVCGVCVSCVSCVFVHICMFVWVVLEVADFEPKTREFRGISISEG